MTQIKLHAQLELIRKARSVFHARPDNLTRKKQGTLAGVALPVLNQL